MEGGATQLAGILSLKEGAYPTYKNFLKFENQGYIIPALSLYKMERYKGKNILQKYGEDRECVDKNLLQEDHQKLYYANGLVAISYAINKANKKFASSGGRTSKDFWQSTGTKGFWHNITPQTTGLSYATDSIASIAEGKGWRKAFCDFTGYATTNEFYKEYQTFMETATEASVSAIMETDAQMAEISKGVYTLPTDKTRFPHVANLPADYDSKSCSESDSDLRVTTNVLFGVFMMIGVATNM